MAWVALTNGLAMAETDQERTEQATGKRRQEFREKGQVAQSREVNTAAMMTATLLLWVFYARFFWEDLGEMMEMLLRMLADFQATKLSAINLLWTAAMFIGKLLSPIFLLCLVVGFFASYLQIGALFTTKVFIPDIKKFNPIKGMKKFVSKRSAVELVKSLAKVSLIGFIAYYTIYTEFSTALDLIRLDITQTLLFLGKVAFLVIAKTCAILVLLAAIDLAYVRWEMEEQMKMTKQEVKEEHKDQDGDPQVKGKIRSLQMQMARKRMLAEVPEADVIITNPTHLSIAISYRREQMDAPTIVAKGADHLAFRIREIAKEHQVPIVENKPVARALYQHEVGEQIPEELFKAVAEVLAYVYSLKNK